MENARYKINRWRVYTERYALSPYIKQTRLVFKGLNIIHTTRKVPVEHAKFLCKFCEVHIRLHTRQKV